MVYFKEILWQKLNNDIVINMHITAFNQTFFFGLLGLWFCCWRSDRISVLRRRHRPTRRDNRRSEAAAQLLLMCYKPVTHTHNPPCDAVNWCVCLCRWTVSGCLFCCVQPEH